MEMNKKVIVLAIIALMGCKKQEVNNKQGGLNDTRFIDLSVFNSAGEDLLDPLTEGHLNIDEIKLYYEQYGKMVEIYYPLRDNPRNVLIFKAENEYRADVVLNNYKDTCNTLIAWSKDDIDTLRATYYRMPEKPEYQFLRKVWLNGGLIWDIMKDEGRVGYYKIIK